jgi:hypothetical protein
VDYTLKGIHNLEYQKFLLFIDENQTEETSYKDLEYQRNKNHWD